ncbi:peptide-methionine (S)-S-oxide reductase MsrA [Parvibaculum sp.]|uniref:peptide-methionine (S)-S-oxide reductase MsrA n=1 Tax=Parvibaculum sp. TaxID=2024848 RepID=UPI00391DA83C
MTRTILAAMTGLALLTSLAATPARAGEAVAIFAGGCFWCMEPPYDKTEGVLSTTAGYTGGHVANPGYKDVSAGTTGHLEAVKIVYDPEKVTYEKLLYIFWRNIDPVRKNAQFCDVGEQYRSAIFPQDDAQRTAAEKSKADLEATGRFTQPIATEILDAAPFYAAEEYHQDYYKKNPNRYAYYRWSCGRDARLEQIWGNEAGGL